MMKIGREKLIKNWELIRIGRINGVCIRFVTMKIKKLIIIGIIC